MKIEDILKAVKEIVKKPSNVCGQYTAVEWVKMSDAERYKYAEGFSHQWRKEKVMPSDLVDYFDAMALKYFCEKDVEAFGDLLDDTSITATTMFTLEMNP